MKNTMLLSISDIILECFIQVLVVGVVYQVGYMQWSVAWLTTPVILSVLRKLWHKEREYRRNLAKAAALTTERRVVYAKLSRYNDLPAWVCFPDVERAEWLNKILHRMWPNVNHFARNFLEEILADLKPTTLRFERIILGAVPPRVGGVKVYNEDVSPCDEIIMDIDFCYAGDCEITLALQPSSYLQLMRAGITDLQIRGMLRVVMKPLIRNMPLVGALEISFINNPTIDFGLIGPVGVFGVSDLLRGYIVDQVANMMVFPKKLVINLSDGSSSEGIKRAGKKSK